MTARDLAQEDPSEFAEAAARAIWGEPGPGATMDEPNPVDIWGPSTAAEPGPGMETEGPWPELWGDRDRGNARPDGGATIDSAAPRFILPDLWVAAPRPKSLLRPRLHPMGPPPDA